VRRAEERLRGVDEGAQLRLGAPPLGHVALRAPDAREAAALDRAGEAVDEEARAALAVDLDRLGLGERVAGADEGAQVLDVLRVFADEEVAEARAAHLVGGGEAVHARGGVVALGEVAVAIEEFDLLVLRERGGDGLLELEAPDALGAVGDEGAVALLAGAQGAQQLVLGARRLLGLLARGLLADAAGALLLGGAAVGHVVRDAEEADGVPGRVADDALRHAVVGAAAARADGDALEDARLARGEHLAVGRHELPRGVGRVEVCVEAADDLGGGPPDEARAGRVDEEVAPLQVFDEDRVGRALDDGAHHAVAVVVRLHVVCTFVSLRAGNAAENVSPAGRPQRLRNVSRRARARPEGGRR
jgi:hypothetical protein